MLIFKLVPCYLEDKLLILAKLDQKINGKQLLINSFNYIIYFENKSPRRLRKKVNNIYIHLIELAEISLSTAAQFESARRVLYLTRHNLW